MHLLFSSSRWSMRVFSTIVRIAARSVHDVGREGTPRNAIATQTIGDDALGLILETVQQAFEEVLGSGAIAFLLHQNIHWHCQVNPGWRLQGRQTKLAR